MNLIMFRNFIYKWYLRRDIRDKRDDSGAKYGYNFNFSINVTEIKKASVMEGTSPFFHSKNNSACT